jgi:hypothetical protein
MVPKQLRKRGVAVALVLSLMMLVVTVPAASAATTTDASVVVSADRLQTGETTTVDVVVGNVDGGVGAAEMRIAVTDPSVASIEDVSVRGGSMFTETNFADDGSSVDVEYAGANTSNSGRVTILSVTITGQTAGSTAISLGPSGGEGEIRIYDEEGSGYDLSSTADATLSVDRSGADDRSGGGDDDDGRDAPSDERSTDRADQSTDADVEGETTATTVRADATTTPADTAGKGDSAADAADGTATDAPENADDAAAATPDAADGSAESVPNASPIPFGVGGVSAWAAGAVLAALAAALFAVRRLR